MKLPLVAVLLLLACVPAAQAVLRPAASESLWLPSAAEQRQAVQAVLRRGEPLYCGGPSGNAVALTFDDGPGPYTEGILEALQHEHAHATFFVLGSLAHDNPDMVRELYAAGMQIGNHTWTHPQLARLGASKQQSELERTQVQIAKIIGVRPRFYRPPYWSWNDLTIREGGELGMIGVLFSVDTDDWERPGTEAIINAALKAQAGDVIAFHDAGGDRSQTVDAVASIVVGLRERGLEPVTLDKLYGDAPE
jgi:peptidoglycan/xylan/chitin deacetylase (PgdA/CDA1 family)